MTYNKIAEPAKLFRIMFLIAFITDAILQIWYCNSLPTSILQYNIYHHLFYSSFSSASSSSLFFFFVAFFLFFFGFSSPSASSSPPSPPFAFCICVQIESHCLQRQTKYCDNFKTLSSTSGASFLAALYSLTRNW